MVLATRIFSEAWAQPLCVPYGTRRHLSALTRMRICLHPPPTSLNRDFHHPDGLPFYVPPSLKCWLGGTGILTCFPSPTPFDLSLGTDLPWADDLYPGNLRLTASGILTRFIVTHVSIISCTTSSAPHGTPSQASAMLPYPRPRRI